MSPTAELVAHRERVGRHARAVITGISDARALAQTAPAALEVGVECVCVLSLLSDVPLCTLQEEEYLQQMESLVHSLADINTSAG